VPDDWFATNLGARGAISRRSLGGRNVRSSRAGVIAHERLGASLALVARD